ncbi:hypothetical protein K435DRAFT_834426 [Dendrothele bispora CBS 962.96]|uniref:Copper acquisition factor BIM1-like domain-containing protein n=1 Tax=Dendrothele bispora (strain CBS 962.96) TaxID=1314807 RepID=A0A4V4HIB2_DENBC|nr:hypothetical protein K435DRAFT_834426 [Dendrothele bispora CBS 962.96]
MRAFSVLSLLGFASIAAAHFQLQFPSPRGVFDEDNEPNFCDGYNDPATNRTKFPLSGGFYTLNSEHPTWTVSVSVSNLSNPQHFENFSQVTSFAQLNGEGIFCLPLDFSTSANASAMNLRAGDNVTIQIQFAADDGNLFQCADLTLEDSNSTDIQNATTCSNATDNSASGNDDSAAIEGASINFAMSLFGILAFTLAFV